MPAIALRQDYDAARLRALARASRDDVCWRWRLRTPVRGRAWPQTDGARPRTVARLSLRRVACGLAARRSAERPRAFLVLPSFVAWKPDGWAGSLSPDDQGVG